MNVIQPFKLGALCKAMMGHIYSMFIVFPMDIRHSVIPSYI